ncbi:MAG: hypothetical protein ACHBN1_22375 [Heteroscytonema crispum UTEX LB 1556]
MVVVFDNQHPTTNTQQPNGRTSYLRECYPPAVRASPTPNTQ